MAKTKTKTRKTKMTEPASLEPVASSPVAEPTPAPEPAPEPVPELPPVAPEPTNEPKGVLCMSTRLGTFITGPVTWDPMESRRLSEAELADRRVQRALATGQIVRV